jgi:hypothetical protein
LDCQNEVFFWNYSLFFWNLFIDLKEIAFCFVKVNIVAPDTISPLKNKFTMKIKSLFLIAFFAVFASQAFAKKDVTSNGKEKIITEAQLKSFDFQKVYKEAEKYYQDAKAWEKIKCEPKSGFICTKRDCVKRDIKAYLILDKKEKTISRCESKDVCETFPAQFNQTGVFFNVQSDGPVGTLIRILGDYRYKEITTIGLDAYIANGECVVQ